jgi:hypothetical protein
LALNLDTCETFVERGINTEGPPTHPEGTAIESGGSSQASTRSGPVTAYYETGWYDAL